MSWSSRDHHANVVNMLNLFSLCIHSVFQWKVESFFILKSLTLEGRQITLWLSKFKTNIRTVEVTSWSTRDHYVTAVSMLSLFSLCLYSVSQWKVDFFFILKNLTLERRQITLWLSKLKTRIRTVEVSQTPEIITLLWSASWAYSVFAYTEFPNEKLTPPLTWKVSIYAGIIQRVHQRKRQNKISEEISNYRN